jgi:hypothetical protein
MYSKDCFQTKLPALCSLTPSEIKVSNTHRQFCPHIVVSQVNAYGHNSKYPNIIYVMLCRTVVYNFFYTCDFTFNNSSEMTPTYYLLPITFPPLLITINWKYLFSRT